MRFKERKTGLILNATTQKTIEEYKNNPLYELVDKKPKQPENKTPETENK